MQGCGGHRGVVRRVSADRCAREAVSLRRRTGLRMSKASDEFWQRARQVRAKADARTDELRGLLLTIADSYLLLARVQQSLDDERDLPPRVH